MVTKKELKRDLLPVLRKKYMDNGAEEVYESFDIKGYRYGDMFEMFTMNDKLLQYKELDDYYRRNSKTYDWKEVIEWSHKNATNLNYKFTKYPKNPKVWAVKHKSATSVLFSPSVMQTISKDQKMLVCPLYEDFVLFMSKNNIDDFIKFVEVIKAMNFSIFQSGKTEKYIGDTIFIYDPKFPGLSTINTEKEFGCNFNVVTLNFSEGQNIQDQIRKEAVNLVKKKLEGASFEEICTVAENKELQDALVDDAEDQIRGAMKRGKNSKR